MRRWFVLPVAVLAFAVSAQKKPLEVTQSDFTKVERIRSTDLMTYGIALGDSIETAKRMAERAGLRWVHSERFAGSYSIYSGREEIVGMNAENGRLVKIVWFRGMATRLAGEAGNLLSPNSADPESAVRLKLLGREDHRSEEHSVIGTTVSYSYDREGLRLVRSTFSLDPKLISVTVHLVEPARARP